MMETIRTVLSFFEAVGQVVGTLLVAAIVVGAIRFAWMGRASRRMPPAVSPTGGPLRADGAKPNWVASTAPPRDPLHYIAPRPSPSNPVPALLDHLRQGKFTVVAATERYIHATQSSARFGFVDDLEFLYDPNQGLLHARSASRVGYSDFGVNRRRLEAIFRATGLAGNGKKG
ncbi:hypothetical protein DFW101_1773 [Solidesulfovibrio carbinoliphilus subsp. oakridgensis]|uniref:DUF1499 domain-containing protein n=1 Tax=Solidesulfovibrio carbinoliphilus subsp. oakridgensis TaxID=694327 RepID=G7Q958_9BACT|nr:DUF1499 domain-containing protein [Solidesulfovibrio carbinoliphilus]EHJ47780.1 hypothetical protein DFW101_1773 [Solidesulfovibrio carbinoliphilus subsp. oakridgensis]